MLLTDSILAKVETDPELLRDVVFRVKVVTDMGLAEL